MPQKAKLGQNFLVDPSARIRIVEALGDISQKTVVEIGPGKAAITELLAQRARKLIAVELDRELAPLLSEKFTDAPVEIIEQDILTVDLAALRGSSEDKLLVVGNLPYYITSDILLHLFRYHDAISRAVVMMQREVGDRVAAAPGSSDYGSLSATTQLYAKVEDLLTLPPNAFSPPPKVHSSVLRLTFAPRFEELHVDPQGFIAFLRQCFAQKRKTLANNLRAAGVEAARISAAAASAGISPLARAEALPLEAMAKLYRSLK
ncbi:16S rRNA (adenine(1518)-N(6)/adenine(1519)-N(6))-dimethyltransferase RsmA [Acidobacterium sp. S8]|uniref:16S rRNA (adenine(1518)-N(6)/adenine(1519)-N(6))- dimethyltransferase RsmA n=1 Tax=Acidobacterium sp. S8 TaxID=1641854 RepID=UPI00131D7F3D|nr:16S rRNA (adenine(1518)-N(6)/adenine(1519)-N(6))-dimethyltransferase RsmA [Acidobacterium sp. S8]